MLSINKTATPTKLDTPYFFTRYTAKDIDESERCQVKNRNQAFLKWNEIDGASAYEIKILKGNPFADDWLDPSKTFIDTIVSSNRNTITIPNLDYTITFSFSIRAVSPFGEEYDSDWWGQAGFTEYRKILSMQMDSRYSIPFLITGKSDLTDTSVKLHINRKVDESAEEYPEWVKHFNITTDAFGNRVWRTDYCIVTFSKLNQAANTPADIKIRLDDTIFDSNGTATLNIKGLLPNSVYDAGLIDSSIPITIDSSYGGVHFRTKNESTPVSNISADKHTTADNNIYNLTGQKVTRMSNGIYIKNGKKFFNSLSE